MSSARVYILLALVTALVPLGCKKSSSESGGGGSGSSQVSGLEREAKDAAWGEIQKRWVKGPEGWITAMTSGAPSAPDHYLRQFRELAVERVEPAELGDSDRMNGFEWAGRVAFKQSPCREAGDPGFLLEGITGAIINRQRGHWTQWVDLQPDSLRVQKVKGQWQVNPDTLLLRGRLPGPADFASAGVQ